jgi:hypothetical protein
MSKQLTGPLLVFSLAASAWLAGEAFGLGPHGARDAVEPRAVAICRDAVVLTRATDDLGRMADCAAATPAHRGVRRPVRVVRG